MNLLQGDYAFVVTDSAKNTYMATRDPIGVCPLYWGHTADGAVMFASEMKALLDDCADVDLFPPGHLYTPEGGLQRWFNPVWWDEAFLPSQPVDLGAIRASFEKAVHRRMMAEVRLEGLWLLSKYVYELIFALLFRVASNFVSLFHSLILSGPVRRASLWWS